jgi:hypothetical protein
MSGQPPDVFDPARALRVLTEHGVRFVVIGGLAANVLGSPSATFDLDICYARDPDNLEALASALTELGARLRGVDVDVPFKIDARTLHKGDSFTFVTVAGSVDVLGTPSGSGGYDDLQSGAAEIDLLGVIVKVASLDALIRMKRAAARRKDLVEVEILEALKDEIENPPRKGRSTRAGGRDNMSPS